jgi:hypothetical protein
MSTALESKMSYTYTLEDIRDFIFKGFDYSIPEHVMNKINELSKKVGSPDYIKTPVFKKRENIPNKQHIRDTKPNQNSTYNEWDTLKKFKATKIETKTGGELDEVRSYINKITDKNCKEMTNKIIEIIQKLMETRATNELETVANTIFDIASSNRYFSKNYAELYAALSNEFEFMKLAYQEHFKNYLDLFEEIQYVDPDENYDKFCQVNKQNEKRKALSTFYLNLMFSGVISKCEIIQITKKMFEKLRVLIDDETKKKETEELTDNITILYQKDFYEDYQKEVVSGLNINQIIEKLAKSKAKDYKGLTNKTLFKFMDLVEM